MTARKRARSSDSQQPDSPLLSLRRLPGTHSSSCPSLSLELRASESLFRPRELRCGTIQAKRVNRGGESGAEEGRHAQ